MTTSLDEVYAYVPGGQDAPPTASAGGPPVYPGFMTLACSAFAAIAYNSPQATAATPSRDFSPLDNLVAQARIPENAMGALDNEDDLQEQRENALGLRDPQLDVIFRESD